jgi:hypothetical protein
MSSSVARSTTRGTIPSSKTIRASVTSAAVSGESCSRSARPSPSRACVGEVTNAPPRAPTRTSISPPASSTRRASRTVTLLTPKRSHRSRSDGSRSPARKRPCRISWRIWSTITCDTRPTLTALKRSAPGALPAGTTIPFALGSTGGVSHAMQSRPITLAR